MIRGLIPRPLFVRMPPPFIKRNKVDDGFIRGYRNNKIDTCYSKCGRYGFVRKSIKPIIFHSNDPEQRGDFIDFSRLKFWK